MENQSRSFLSAVGIFISLLIPIAVIIIVSLYFGIGCGFYSEPPIFCQIIFVSPFAQFITLLLAFDLARSFMRHQSMMRSSAVYVALLIIPLVAIAMSWFR